MRILLPLRTVSAANLREHWAVKARRTKAERSVTAGMVRFAMRRERPLLPVTVTLTRIGPRALDTDNLARSLKAVRDGIADALGVDDGAASVVWQYAQAKGKPKEHAVLVDIIGQASEHARDAAEIARGTGNDVAG